MTNEVNSPMIIMQMIFYKFDVNHDVMLLYIFHIIKMNVISDILYNEPFCSYLPKQLCLLGFINLFKVVFHKQIKTFCI